MTLVCGRRCRHGGAQALGQSKHPAALAYQHNSNRSFEQGHTRTCDALFENERGGAEGLHPRGYLQHFIDAGGFEVFQLHAAHDEGGGFAAIARLHQGVVIVAEQSQIVAAAALAPADVAGVIDEAGEIRVFEVDADREDVGATGVASDKAAGEIGPIVGQ
jgi:hypothetical protein